MDSVGDLERSLGESNRAALADLDLADLGLLQEELAALRAWEPTGAGIEAIDDARIAAAMRAFRESGTLEGIGQARLACYGCTQEIDGQKLIEAPERFAALIEYVDRYRNFPRPFRRCYRPLLDAYFAYDPEESGSEEGRQSWRELWNFLERRKGQLETPGADPEWVTALLEHRNLLTRDPASRYGMAALRGNEAAFDAVRSRLHIGDGSWVMRRLVLAELEAALALGDPNFKTVVVRLLVLLAKHPFMLDYGLGRLVDRYAASSGTEAHARLREFAVRNWGDPRVPSNAPHWRGVKPASRDMVAGWMKGAPDSERGEV